MTARAILLVSGVLGLLAVSPVTARAADSPSTASSPVQTLDLTVVGLDGRTVTVTPKDAADLPRADARMGAKSYQGPTLTSILRLVGAPAGPTLHGKPMRDYLLVTGPDGFQVVLSLAETDASLAPHAAILADSVAGAPLDAHEGPYRLVIDGDLKPFRSVRGVVRIELKAAP